MLGISRRTAFLTCAVSAAVAQSLVRSCSAAPAEVAPSNQQRAQELTSVNSDFVSEQQIVGPPTLDEGENPASQVAALNQIEQVEALNFLTSTADSVERNVDFNNGRAAAARRLRSKLVRFRNGSRRRPGSLGSTELPEGEYVFTFQQSHPRRLALFDGLSQLAQPFSAFTGLFGSGLSARDKDLLETFSRRVATSRERIYKDLLFVTGGRHQGLDEFAMKQLVAKVGLENLSSGQFPSYVQLSHPESVVLDAAKRSRFQVDRIISTYEREVAQHAKSLRQDLQADASHIRSKIDSIVSEGLFKKRTVPLRRLQQSTRLRRLAALLDGPSLLGAAGSLFRSIDPSNLTNSLNAGLGGLGLHHLRLPNIGGLALRNDGRSPSRGLQDGTALLQALEPIFPLPQQANALSIPLLSFQQGVSTATDGAIGAFLSKEGLMPFLSVDFTKQLLGSLIGGDAVASRGESGWEALGLSPAAVKGLAAVMPFEMFLNKLGILAQEVDADVGTLRREAKKRIGAGSFPLLPEQLVQVDSLLDRLVWGTLQAPARRLQQVEEQQQRKQLLDSQQQTPEAQQQKNMVKQPTPEFQQQFNAPRQGLAASYHAPESRRPPPASQQQTHAAQPRRPEAHQQAPATKQRASGSQEQQALGTPQQPFEVQNQNLGTQQQTPTHDVQKQISDVQQQASNVQQQTPTQQSAPDVQQQASNVPQQASNVQQQAPNVQQQTSSIQLHTANIQQQTPNFQQETRTVQQQAPEVQQQSPPGEQQQQPAPSQDDDEMDSLFESLFSDEGLESAEDQMDAALQRVELLADAVTVLLKEYERAVEHLQKLLDDQIDAAEDIRDELEEQLDALKKQVNKAHDKQQDQARNPREAAATAAAQVAKAYDEAMEGLRGSLEGLLQQEQQQAIPGPVQQQLGALAAKIEAAAEEGRLPQVTAR